MEKRTLVIAMSLVAASSACEAHTSAQLAAGPTRPVSPLPVIAPAARQPRVRIVRIDRTKPKAQPPVQSTTRDDSVAQLCVDEINRYRASIGRAPVQRLREREACADDQARADASAGRAHATFGRCSEGSQNECPGWGGPADKMIRGCLEMMWKEGPGGGHYENMAGDAKQVSCGFFTNDKGEIWSVQDFR